MRKACFDVLDKRDDLMNILPRYTDCLGLLVNTIRLDNLFCTFSFSYVSLFFTLLWRLFI